MKIKVCGMRQAQNIREVEALGIDMMGFIFYHKSKRYVAEKPAYLPQNCTRTGVFVNAEIDEIEIRVDDFGLGAVQLHGNETPEFCRQLRRRIGKDVLLIKALSARDTASLDSALAYDGIADLLLFDTPTQQYGGSGNTFDWQLLDHYTGNTPFMLSGGISAEMADAVNAFSHPRFAGIDLNSRFETEPALKNIELLSKFIKQIR